MKYIDIKYTVWEKLFFHDGTDMNEKIREIKEGRSPHNGYNEEEGFLEAKILYDTLQPIENDSVKIHVEGKCIWNNSKKTYYE